MSRGKRHGGAARVVAAALIVVGNVVLFWPELEGLAFQARSAEIYEAVDAQAAQLAPVTSSSASESAPIADERVVQSLAVYNARVREQGVDGIGDPFLTPDTAASPDSLGFEDGLLGYLEIPVMGSRLPLYYGATDQNLDRGVAVLEGTTVPLGEPTSNCVVAGHRSRIFTYIEKLQPGDLVQVHTVWGAFYYRVSQVRIIDPDDAEALLPVEGTDQLTLFTCHPYPTTRQRYLVICDRTAAPAADNGSVPLLPVAGGEKFRLVTTDNASVELLVKLGAGVASLVCMGVLVAGGLRSRGYGRHMR